MVETRIYCDKCGELIVLDRTVLAPQCGRLRHRAPFDLCDSCADALLQWMGPEPKPEPGPASL
jgi:hypothetical protein